MSMGEMSAAREQIPIVSTSRNFATLLMSMGGSRGLLLVLCATVIWGFQPYFMRGEILKLLHAGEPLFIVLRYSFASIFLLLLLAPLYLRNRTRSPEKGVSSEARASLTWLLRAALMGLFMYISRFSEVRSYGEGGQYTAFGIVFSIFFVLLWDWKKWAFHELNRRLRKAGAVKIAKHLDEVSAPLQSPAELMSWFIQSLLVLMAGLLFVYAQEGRLPAGGAIVTSIMWALFSSLMLSLFYDLAIRPAAASSGLSAKVVATIHTQVLVGISGLFFAIPHWILSSGDVPKMFNDLMEVWAVIQSWSVTDRLLYFAGYIGGVTCIAYILESVGLITHDRNHRFGDWRITGREWASIATMIDPLVSVLIVVPILALPSAESDRTWFWLAGAGVLGVGIQSFLRLWLAKSGQMRGRALGALNAPVSEGIIALSQTLRWLSRLMLFRLESTATFDAFVAEQNEEWLGPSHNSNLARVLLRSHLFTHRGQLAVDCIRVQNGRELFDPQDAEGDYLWKRYADYLTSGTDSRLVVADEIQKILVSEITMYPEKSIPHNLIEVKSGIEALIKSHEHDLGIAHVYGIVGDESDSSSITADKHLLWVREAGSQSKRTTATERALHWQTVLSPEEYRRLAAIGPITTYHHRGYRFNEQDIIIGPALPESVSVDESSIVLVQAELIREHVRTRKNLPEWLASRDGKACPIVVWSEADTRWLVQNLLYGSTMITKKGLPMLSELGRDTALRVGEYGFTHAVHASIERWLRTPDIVVISDDSTIRDSVWRHLAPATMGLRCRFTAPESIEAAIDVLGNVSFPLVLFSPTLDLWETHLDGVKFLSPYLDACDPYLLRPDIRLLGTPDWPLAREVTISEEQLARVLAGHLGTIPDKDESHKYSATSLIVDHLQEQLYELNQEIESGAVKRHCYGLFFALGARRST